MASLGRRQRVEASLNKCGKEEREFVAAKQKEVGNWKKFGVVRVKVIKRSEETIPDELNVMRMRWVLTRQSSSKAKPRLVIKGYEDRDLPPSVSASPTCSMHARNVVLLIAAHHVDPPADVRQILGVEADDFCKLVGPGYGTVNAPRSWWQRVRQDFKVLKASEMKLEPCVWGVHGKT